MRAGHLRPGVTGLQINNNFIAKELKVINQNPNSQIQCKNSFWLLRARPRLFQVFDRV